MTLQERREFSNLVMDVLFLDRTPTQEEAKLAAEWGEWAAATHPWGWTASVAWALAVQELYAKGVKLAGNS